MKKLISLIIILAFIASFACVPADAKILSECHCCGGDGIYTCDAIDCKDGKLPCGNCNGTGESVEMCADCNGTGKCRICEGTGKRLGDKTIDCDNCKGSGLCQGGPGWGPCTQGYYREKCPACNGEGEVWHDNEWCIYARNHDGQCPVCKGTGFEGDGVEGTPNDGVSNVPKPGDGIYYLDGTYAVYGSKPSDDNTSKDDPSDDTSSDDTSPNESSSDDASTDDASSAESTDTAESDDPQTSGESGSYELLPEDKHMTMYLGTQSVDSDDFAGTTATGAVIYQEMTEDEKAVYDSLSDEELDNLLVQVRDIISTVKVGEIAADSQDSVDAFFKANGINDYADANIVPVSFDGHIDINFPVLVSVEVDPNRFDGSKAIHVFHIKEDGSVAQIPDEDVTGIASEGDGRISRVEFYTDSFSDFLLSDAEDLVVPAVTAPEVVEDLSAVSKDSEESSGAIIIAVIAVVILIPAAILAVVFLKKRKKTGPNE